ncbi:MAG: hypothetical protein FWE80_03235 [Oscillospiraceae bacterium]|nr:hypothetical protein [Oscillospiraceae bacterium]
MPVELSVGLIISIISVCFAVYSGIHSRKRDARQETKIDATQMTTIMVELKHLSTGMTEIKTELKTEVSDIKDEIKDIRERLIKMEESTKAAHRRLDGMG